MESLSGYCCLYLCWEISWFLVPLTTIIGARSLFTGGMYSHKKKKINLLRTLLNKEFYGCLCACWRDFPQSFCLPDTTGRGEYSQNGQGKSLSFKQNYNMKMNNKLEIEKQRPHRKNETIIFHIRWLILSRHKNTHSEGRHPSAASNHPLHAKNKLATHMK